MKQFLRDSVTIAIKELRLLSRDPIALALTIMFPILLISIFIVISTAFSAPSYNIPIVIADLDDSSISKQLIDEITRSSIVRVTRLFYTEEQAIHTVEIGKATGALIIPKGFGDALLSQARTFVLLQTDNSKIMSQTLIQIAVNSEVQNLLDIGSAQFEMITTPIEIILRPISGRPASGDPILPGMLGMIIILGAFDDIVNAVTRERELGTFPRLVLTPVSMFAIYTGKMIMTVVVTWIRTTFMLLIFQFTGVMIRGNLILIYFATSLIAIFTLSVGLLLSSKIKSSATLTILEIAIAFPLFQLSGATQSPELLASGGKAIAQLLPWTYGNIALRRIIYLGLGFEAVFPSLLILSISSLIVLPIATLLSERTI